MAVISAKDQVKIHNQLVEKFREHLKSLDADKPPTEDVALVVKEEAVSALRTTLADVKKGRDEVVGRFDTKIANLTAELSRLETELEQDRKRQTSPDTKGGPARKKAKGGSPAKGGTGGGDAAPSVPLEKVKGIGPNRAKALRKAGIGDVAALREAPADELKKILGPMDYRELKTRSVAALKAAAKGAGGSGRSPKSRK